MTAKPGRDIRIDALRGLILIVMTMDHFPSLFFNYTYELPGYVTTAEGFVFLSGLVAGKVYQRYGASTEPVSLWDRAWKRAGYIYSCHLLTFLALFSIAVLFAAKIWGLEIWTPLFYQHPAMAVVLGITLMYQPQYLDILPMYALLILTVPAVAECAKRNRLMVVFFCSLATWLLAQFGFREYLQSILGRYGPVHLGYFDIFAWQSLFLLGVCVGIRGFGAFVPRRFQLPVLLVCIVLEIILFSARHGLILANSQFTIESWSLVGRLGPIRILNFVVVVVLVRQVLPWVTENWMVRGLALLGRHSLEVFTFHVFLIYLFFGIFRNSPYQEMLTLFFAGSLFLPAFLADRFQNPWKVWYYFLVNGNRQGVFPREARACCNQIRKSDG